MELPKSAPVKKNVAGYPIEGTALLPSETLNAKIPITEKNILIGSIDEYFKNDVLTKNDVAEAQGVAYWGSQYQRMQYEQLRKRDPVYEQYIMKTYGSYSNFEQINSIGDALDVFNPYVDYKIDVTIITKDKYYKTDHISPYEIISESLSGLCTVDYLQVNGRADKLTGTLYKKYILPSKINERVNFFFPMMGNRIGLWNIVKQKWSSFYMNKVIRFVRDDTTGLE